jgi:hypothetical protein
MNVLACNVLDKTCEQVLNAYVSRSNSITRTMTMSVSPTPSVVASSIQPVTHSNSNEFFIIIAASAGSISCLLVLLVILQYLYFRQRVRPSPLSQFPRFDSQISMSPMLPARAAAPTLEDEVLNDPCSLGEPAAIMNNPMIKNVAI